MADLPDAQPLALMQLPYHMFPRIFEFLSHSVSEYISLGRVCRAWRVVVLNDVVVFRTMLARCIAESRWFAKFGVVDLQSGDSNAVAALDTVVQPRVFEFPLAGESLDGQPAPVALVGDEEATPFASDGLILSPLDQPASRITPKTVPGAESLRSWLDAAEAAGEGYDFGRYALNEFEDTWLQPLMRFHCSLDNYMRLCQLGNERSCYYKARALTTRQIVCLKDCFQRRDSIVQGVPPKILREISLFQQLRHPAILTPNRVIVETDNDGVLQGLFLSFELLGPSLREAVFQKDKPLPPQRVRAYMLDILGAMAYLHSKGIVRRTLQLDKLLLTPDEQHVKMNNFEMAKQFSQWLGCDSSQAWKVSHCDDGDPDERHTNRGPASPKLNYNLCYSPPELIMGQVLDSHDWTVDSWHAGCMMAGMVKGEPLVFGDSGIGQLMQVFSILGPPDERTWPGVSKLPYYPHFLPKFIGKPMSKLIPLNDTVADRELIWDVLTRLLRVSPRQRMSPAEALDHPYFTGGTMEHFLLKHPRLDFSRSSCPRRQLLLAYNECQANQSCDPEPSSSSDSSSDSDSDSGNDDDVDEPPAPTRPVTRASRRAQLMVSLASPQGTRGPAVDPASTTKTKPNGRKRERSAKPTKREAAAEQGGTKRQGVAVAAPASGSCPVIARNGAQTRATASHSLTSSDASSDSDNGDIDFEEVNYYFGYSRDPVDAPFPGHDRPFDPSKTPKFPVLEGVPPCCVERELAALGFRRVSESACAPTDVLPYYASMPSHASTVDDTQEYCTPGHVPMTPEAVQALSWLLSQAQQFGGVLKEDSYWMARLRAPQ